MATGKQTLPRWITVRLGDDLNWWLQRTGDELESVPESCGVLDPRQVDHLVKEFDAYRPYGYSLRQFSKAFQVYTMDSELSEGLQRLIASDEDLGDMGGQLFAVPRTTADDAGPYEIFLGEISTARIRLLNATHKFAVPCTEEEMYDELRAIDSGRFFSDETIHVFNEITEMLEWSPAEWEESES